MLKKVEHRIWRLGIVGCGGAFLCIHLPILQQLSKNFEIVALYDIERERAVLFGKRIANVKLHQSFESLLEDSIDMVVILSQDHETFIEQALNAQKQVFTEKPISLDLHRSYQLQELAKSKGLLLEVGLMRLYDKVVQEFYRVCDPKSILSCVFYKSDGSDVLIRRSLMPTELNTYNFKNSNTIFPESLNEKQISILKMLLWSGIHLLTTLCQIFNKVTVIHSFVNKQNSSLFCNFKTELDQSLSFHICNTNSPVYLEDIRVITEDIIGHLTFESPYITGSRTQGSMIKQGNAFISRENIKNYESPFFSMWDHISEVLAGRKKSFSLEIALKVENLVREIALSV